MMNPLERGPRAAATVAMLYFSVLIPLSRSSPRVVRMKHDCAFAPLSSHGRCETENSRRIWTKSSWHPSLFRNSRLHLFSSKFDGDRGDYHDDDEDELDLDFPTWARTLRRWPLYPTSKSSTSQENNESSEERIPLANLINVEALLMASGEETMDNAEDIELFEFGTTTGNDDVRKDATSTKQGESPTPLSILPSLEELGNWDKLFSTIQRSISGLTGSSATLTTDTIMKEATGLIEDFVSEASVAISPATVQDLIVRASRTLYLEENANTIVQTAEKIAQQRGLNVTEAAERAKETTKFTTNLVKLANGVLVSGYVAGDEDTSVPNDDSSATDNTKPLFHGFKSVAAISSSEYNRAVKKGAEMGDLAASIYMDTIPRIHGRGHSMVANGTSSDVTWMITDSVAYEDQFGDSGDAKRNSGKPIFVRTITISGFDASDESVDREQLLNTICTANPVTMGVAEEVQVHSGLLSLARAVYRDIEKYIDLTAPTHRLVITGHSIGGSVSTLLLFLLVEARGADFVKEKVLRVFTFGSPPVVQAPAVQTEGYHDSITVARRSDLGRLYHCDILEAFGLPETMVYGYVQPWDPIVRLFTNLDPLYPLLGDMGKDGKTLYASGPQRSLRPITRAIIESWEGWPRFRDTFRQTVNQNYTSVGIQHLLLPERVRYLSDRFVSVNVAVPPVETVLRLSAKELLPALKDTFPLDTFQISFVPTAIRSFIHHFYPAYDSPIVEYANKQPDDDAVFVTKDDVIEKPPNEIHLGDEQISSVDPDDHNGRATKGLDWAGAAAQWILGGSGDGI